MGSPFQSDVRLRRRRLAPATPPAAAARPERNLYPFAASFLGFFVGGWLVRWRGYLRLSRVSAGGLAGLELGQQLVPVTRNLLPRHVLVVLSGLSAFHGWKFTEWA